MCLAGGHGKCRPHMTCHASYEEWMVKAAVRGGETQNLLLWAKKKKKDKAVSSEIPIIRTNISKNKKGTWV